MQFREYEELRPVQKFLLRGGREGRCPLVNFWKCPKRVEQGTRWKAEWPIYTRLMKMLSTGWTVWRQQHSENNTIQLIQNRLTKVVLHVINLQEFCQQCIHWRLRYFIQLSQHSKPIMLPYCNKLKCHNYAKQHVKYCHRNTEYINDNIINKLHYKLLQ